MMVLAAFGASCIDEPEGRGATDRSAYGSTQSALGCAPSVALEEVRVAPARITPDGNGVFDSAAVEASVVVEPAHATCVLADRVFAFDLAWTVALLGPAGSAVRRFAGHRRLDFGSCEDGGLEVPIRVDWDGSDASGVPVPPGSYRPMVEAGVRVTHLRSGARLPTDSVSVSGPPIVVSSTHDEGEAAWAEVVALEDAVGRKATHAAWDTDVAYELSSPEQIAELAATLVAAEGRDPDAAFALEVARVSSDPELVVRPDAGQLAVWRDLFIGTSGVVEVVWSPAGTPSEVSGVDAGALSGTAAFVAERYLDSFRDELSALFRLGRLDRLVPGRVLESPDEPFAVVEYRHAAGGQLDTSTFEVPGDFLLVRIRRSGLAQGSGRVVGLSARWNPIVRPPGPAMASEDLRAIAVEASGLADATVAELAEPWVAFPSPGEQRLLTEAYVTGGGGEQARVVRLDAETGEVGGVADGLTSSRVTVRVNPLRPHDDLYEHGYCEIGLPFADVVEPTSGSSVTTSAGGCYEMTGWFARAGLWGPYFEELTLPHLDGTLNDECRNYDFRSRVAATVSIGEERELAVRQVRSGRQRSGDQDFAMATLFGHGNYQAELWRRAGMHPQDHVYLFADFGPLGYRHSCTTNTDCDGCDTSLGTCRAHDFQACTVDAPDCTTAIEPQRICDDRYAGGLCRSGDARTGAAWRRPQGAVAPGAPDNRDPLVRRCSREATIDSPFIIMASRVFQCEKPGGCPTDHLGLGAWNSTFDVHPAAEPVAVRLFSHEYMHHMLLRTDTQFHSNLTRPFGEHGYLSGFLSEALPDSTYYLLYPGLSLWENRSWDHIGFLAHRFGGDPSYGSGLCGGPERDDPLDDYSCPERVAGDADGDGVVAPGEQVVTPTCDPACQADPVCRILFGRCLERYPAADSVCGGVPPPVGPLRNHWCAPGTTTAYTAVDIHHNVGWFLAATARLGYQTGRARAVQDFAGFVRSGIDDATTVSRGTNSVFRLLAHPPGGMFGTSDWLAAEAWRAFTSVVRNPSAPAVHPVALDRETNLAFHGDLMRGASASFGRFRAAAVGRLEEPGRLAVGGTIDRRREVDFHGAYLYGGRIYEVRLEARGTTMRLAWFPDRPRLEGEREPTGTTLGWVAAGDARAFTFVPPADGYYSFRVSGHILGASCVPDGCPYRLDVALGGDCPGDVTADCRDDYPDRVEQAVAVPQTTVRLPGTLVGWPSLDRDQFKVFLSAGSGPATVRVRLPSGFGGWSARVLPPDGGVPIPIATFRCHALGECGYVAQVAAPTTAPGGWYGIEIRRTDTAIEPMSYELSIESAAELPCANRLASAAAFPCVVEPGAGISGTLSSAADIDQLWFQGEGGHVYVIDVGGDVRASLHAPTWYDDPGGQRPGTTRDDRPMFRYSEDWPHPIVIVAPIDGLYRLRVSPGGSSTRTNYFVRIFRSAWTEWDYPAIEEWAGPSVACGLP